MNFLEILARTNFAVFPEWKLRAKLDEIKFREDEQDDACLEWFMKNYWTRETKFGKHGKADA